MVVCRKGYVELTDELDSSDDEPTGQTTCDSVIAGFTAHALANITLQLENSSGQPQPSSQETRKSWFWKSLQRSKKEDKTSDARIGISERPQYIKQFSRSGKSNSTKKKSSVLSSHRPPSSCSRRSVMLTIDEDEEIDLAPCSC